MSNAAEKSEGSKPEKKKKVETPAVKKVKVSSKLALVQDVIALMDASDLSEVHFEQGGMKVHLRRGPAAAYAAPMMPAMPMVAAAAAPASGAPAPAAPAAKAESGNTLNSPMVGTFYRSPSPDAKPFIEEGDSIKVGQVYCIIEAMKLMNEVKSEVAGKVTKILVQNGQAVEFNQPLIVVESN
ncbi:MAG TPA: acetyl-CoA carboxylase biotin carboxyl carrier protein [bacterium]|nr:acetyl-CoA carboxylase biotin carboxyl carrier protein [bacterium]